MIKERLEASMKKGIVILFWVMSHLGLVACGNLNSAFEGSNKAAGTAVNQSAAGNQAPIASCQIRGSDGLPYGTVSSNPNLERIVTPLAAGLNFSLDCSGTLDDRDELSRLQLSFASNYSPSSGSANWVSNSVGGVFGNLGGVFSSPGTYNVAVRVRDSASAESVVVFNILIQCPGTSNLAIDGSRLLVTPSAVRNQFSFDASRAVTGASSGAQLLYRWNYNGDEAFDDFDVSGAATPWTSMSVVRDVYVAYSTDSARPSRKVQLTVRDAVCNWVATGETQVALPIAASRPGEGKEPIPHLHGSVTPRTSSPVQPTLLSTSNVAVRLWNDPAASKRNVRCDYRPGSGPGATGGLKIEAFNSYGGAETAKHGLNLDIIGLPRIVMGTSGSRFTVNVATVPTATDLTSGQISSASYRSAQGFEGVPPAMTYNAPANTCPLKMWITVRDAVVPCGGSSGVSVASKVVVFEGDYNCPALVPVGANGQIGDLKLDQGYFYCEHQISDQCPGGGGGGGGQPPIEI